jgi:hypothetical protein
MSKGRKAAQAAVGQTRLWVAGVAVGLTLSKATHNFIFLLFYFRFLFLSFSLVLVRFASVLLRISMFNLDANEAKENIFFRFEAQKISLLFGFVSLLSENERQNQK